MSKDYTEDALKQQPAFKLFFYLCWGSTNGFDEFGEATGFRFKQLHSASF
jgi:hypothetical protein